MRIRTIAAFIVVAALIIWTTPSFNTAGTEKIYDKNGRLLFEYAGNTGRKQTVSYERFPAHLIGAVTAGEDEQYFRHSGVDLKAIVRSAVLDLQAGRIVSGASTITQQVARLNTGPSSLLPMRVVKKIREVLIALRLSATYSKRDILNLYLNEVYLGNQNYGFQSASQFYFHKNVDKLSLAESAYLSGMISSPGRYDPYLHLSEGLKRQEYVLERMKALHLIDQEQFEAARSTDPAFAHPDLSIKAPHFVDYIHQELTRLGVNGSDVSVYTTLDLDSYELGQRIARDWVFRLRESANVSNAAMIVLDNRTGAIVSMIGGINYFDRAHDGQVNVAVSPRQPGSSIKPVTYTAAFLKGFTPATLIYDVKRSYLTKKGQGFIPNNFGDRYHGLVLAREALASSYNLPAVEMLRRAGLPAFLSTARALGITTFTDPDSYDYSITLGANEVTLLELSNAYATLARGGRYLETHAIDRVTDRNGRTIYQYSRPAPQQKLGTEGEQVAYLITDILSDPEARMPGFGEKNYLTLTRPAAVKTGTTTDWHDVWTVGYTPSYTVGVWMGNNNNDAMRNISSATGAAPVWNQFFEEFLKGTPQEQFHQPAGITRREICTTSGDLADPLCPKRRTELFAAGTEPKKQSTIYKLIHVDRRNGLLAESCPKDVIENEIVVDYPPEVYSWAIASEKPVIPKTVSPLCGAVAGTTSQKLSVTVTNPKQKAVFQNSPGLIKNQGISLEANVSPGIKTVEWYVDGSLLKSVNTFPFSAILPLKTGSHIVYAKGIGQTGSAVSDPVSFRVIDY